ncbi:pleckstrin homology domain-containing family G member 1-like, partial [Limulus polyphemus]|uniref:Pleckstrin homology domain-containing family G member 1-like n=1 Tax=Limulus polyphemus TaxID=6850 RepID=A0ABM1TB78_LIMPO
MTHRYLGSTVDISSSLLKVYDCLVGKSKDEHVGDENEENVSKNVNTDGYQPLSSSVHSPNNLADSRTRSRLLSPKNLSVNDTSTKRPVSTSSVSSSSSSSSSSFPRNGMDVKRSYMASNESLADNGPDEDNVLSCDRLSHHTRISEQKTTGLKGIKHGVVDVGNRVNQKGVVPCRHITYDPSLCPTDRVIMEIVDTERTYVNNLQEIIDGYFQYMLSLEVRKISDQTLEDLSGNIEDIYKFN